MIGLALKLYTGARPEFACAPVLFYQSVDDSCSGSQSTSGSIIGNSTPQVAGVDSRLVAV